MEILLQRLTEIEGVAGAVLVGKDGLVVVGTMEGEDTEVLGAMAAACFSAITRYTEEIGIGEMGKAVIESAHGTLYLAEIGDLILVVSTTPQVNPGRVRLEMARAGHRVAERVGVY